MARFLMSKSESYAIIWGARERKVRRWKGRYADGNKSIQKQAEMDIF